MVKVVMGNFAQPTTEGATIGISNSATDPVPTCQLTLYDDNSSINPQFMQELLILDDQQIPNPTVNLASNPILSPYNGGGWGYTSHAGVTPSQNGGGGLILTFSNSSVTINTAQTALSQIAYVTASQTYCLSVTTSGSSPVHIAAGLQLQWLDAGSNVISTSTSGQLSATGTNRYSLSAQAPSNAVFCYIILTFYVTNATNSGSITYTNVQLEPKWFSSMSYPTPFCGPSQTNCRQLPIGYWIRQYRKFAGFVNFRTFSNYRGNARDVLIKAVGYAWLLSSAYVNNSYSSQFDGFIIDNLLATYLTATTPANPTPVYLIDFTNTVPGVQFSNLASNWDDIRALFNAIASSSTYFWSIGYYWDIIYAPSGYFTMSISLLTDASGTPDNVTTFPAYAVESDMDFTQPGCNIFVFGASGFSAQIMDPAVLAQIATNSGYTFPVGNLFARKVNDSSLGSNADCTNRGMAELLQYDGPRYIYRYTTNVELIAGQGIAVTDVQNSLSKTVLLIQQVNATWLGKSELLQDVWEYQATLGAVNRQATNILSRLARQSNTNTSAPAINTTTLAVLERLGITDTPSITSTLATGYQVTILADSPVAYYRLNELLGTIADDFSGNANSGTLHGGVTLNAAGLLHSGGDPAMSFNGSTGYISLPTSFVPTGAHAWSLECWAKTPASMPANGYYTAMGMGDSSANAKKGVLTLHVTASPTAEWALATQGAEIDGPATVATSTIYYLVATYDGTNQRLYVNGSLAAGPTALALNLAQGFATIGANDNTPAFFYSGTIDEVAFYNYALNATQISNHYTVGTT